MKKFLNILLLAVSFLSTPALLAEMVNINKATAAALQENLKGVGEKKAQAIIAYRKEFGAFKTLDEIMEVKGIGTGIFKKIKADISLNKGITDRVGKKTAGKKTGKTVKTTKTNKALTTDKAAVKATQGKATKAASKTKKSLKKKADKAAKAAAKTKKSG